MLRTTKIHPRYGIQVHDMQLADVTADSGYAELRDAFEQHSFLFFADQELDDEAHLRLGSLFGPREDRTINADKPNPAVSLVSNVKNDQSLLSPRDKALLQLQANMLWHTDSTFLPVPALANILIGRVIPESGSSTEFASTRVAWQDMPDDLKRRVHGLYFHHEYGHSRRKIDAELAEQEMIAHWQRQTWKSTWVNPHNGLEALYIASHACGAISMPEDEAQALIDELTNWCTQSQYVYAHQWQVGDVLIWDERAMLHRGVPWNYNEARSLSSICISARPEDGLDDMR